LIYFVFSAFSWGLSYYFCTVIFIYWLFFSSFCDRSLSFFSLLYQYF